MPDICSDKEVKRKEKPLNSCFFKKLNTYLILADIYHGVRSVFVVTSQILQRILVLRAVVEAHQLYVSISLFFKLR